MTQVFSKELLDVARDCFLAAVLGHSWFCEDAAKDKELRQRGWGWNE